MRKRTFLLLLVLISFLNIFAQDSFESDGIWYIESDGIWYEITSLEDSTVSVTKKRVRNMYYGDYEYGYYEGDIVIPATVGIFHVTSIEEEAFMRSSITSITIPGSVISIGNSAFFWCQELTSVIVEDGVQDIGDGAFSQCVNITEFIIPSSVKTIGFESFSGCGLESLYIPKNLTAINLHAFHHTHPFEIKVDPENPVYDSRNDCNAIIETASDKLILGGMNTVIPFGVKSIGEYAFSGNSYFNCPDTVIIPGSVTTIEEGAFFMCRGLISLELQEGVEIIGDYAFGECRHLDSIVIPKGVKSIGKYAFGGCSNLTSVKIQEGVENIGRRAFCGCPITTIIIPEGVQSVGNEAFESCNRLKTVYIPASVETIDCAFEMCDSLTSIYCFREVPIIYSNSDNYVFSNQAYDNATLYVPDGCVDAYRNANVWGRFQNIREFDPTDVEMIPDVYRADGGSDKSYRVIKTIENGQFIITLPDDSKFNAVGIKVE